METKRAVKVSTYAGYKGDERPTSLTVDGMVLQVTEIIDRWYDIDYNGYKVLVENGQRYLLQHDLNADSWNAILMKEREE